VIAGRLCLVIEANSFKCRKRDGKQCEVRLTVPVGGQDSTGGHDGDSRV